MMTELEAMMMTRGCNVVVTAKRPLVLLTIQQRESPVIDMNRCRSSLRLEKSSKFEVRIIDWP